jgi:hypothetical protein
MPELEGLDQLLADAHTIYHRSLDLILGEIDGVLIDAGTVYRNIYDRLAGARDAAASNFNIFRLTDRAEREVATHQRVLADLLNPLGTHAQGNLFLKPFLALVTDRSGIALPPPNGLWEVDHNKDYIDVRLRHIDSERGRVIIETKWNAPDREKQVIGYWRKEKQRTGLPPHSGYFSDANRACA